MVTPLLGTVFKQAAKWAMAKSGRANGNAPSRYLQGQCQGEWIDYFTMKEL